MGKSVAIRLDQVRAVFHLVGECRDVGHDPTLWLTHMAEGLTRLVNAQFVQTGEFRIEDARPIPVRAVEIGWASEKARRMCSDWSTRSDLPENPLYDPFFGPADPARTQRGAELIPVREWGKLPYYNELMVPCDMGDPMLSRRPTPGGAAHVIAMTKRVGGAPFTARDTAVVVLFHTELAAHLGRALATAADPVARLSRRPREVLRCLIEGDSEKQVAKRLFIAPSTVHEHVTRLYRHFGVSSRAELLAYFLRRYRRPNGP